MRNKSLLTAIVFLIWLPPRSVAQFIDHANLATLRESLAKCTNDNCKIPVLLNIANTYIVRRGELVTDLDSGLLFADKAQQLNKAIGNAEWLGLYDFVYSKDFHERKNMPAAEDMGRKAVDIFVKGNYLEQAGDVLRDMSYYYPTDVDSTRRISIGLCNKAAEYFDKAKAFQKKASVYERLGDLYVQGGEFQRSIDTLNVALTFNRIIHLNNLQSIYKILGEASSSLGNYEDAITYLFASLKITEDAKDSKSSAVAVYNQIGILYFNLENWSDAELYFRKAFKLADSLNQIDDIQGIIHNEVNSMNKLHLFKESLQFQSSIEKKYAYTDSDIYNNMFPFINRCMTYTLMGRPDLMEPYAKKLLFLSNKVPANADYNGAYIILVRYFIFKKDLKIAQKYINILKGVATYTSDFKTDYYLQYLIDSSGQNYKEALQSFKNYNELNDSLIKQKTQKQLTLTKIKYQTEKKDQEISAKQKDIELLSSRDKINKLNLKNAGVFKNIMIAGAVALMALLILLYSRYRIKTRSNQQLQSQQAEISDKNTALQNAVAEKDKLLTEKEWLVKEIHHRVKNNLQIIISLLRMQTTYMDDEEAIRAVGESRHRLQAISLLHQKLYHADQLELIDMEAYIKDLISYLKDSFSGLNNLQFELQVEPIKLQVSYAIPMGLIINEAITNAVKYAFPDNRNGLVSISVLKEKQTISLIIKDNGIGFINIVPEDEIKSMGTRLIQILADQIGGKLQVSSSGGVTIAITSIPYDEILQRPVLNDELARVNNLS